MNLRHEYIEQRLLNLSIVVLMAVPVAITIAICGLLIRIVSGYPAFYVESRPGKAGRPFRCYKLQTIPPGLGGSSLDRALIPARITRLASVLRNHGLDEFPQIVNVLLGNMAWVGPRPLPAPHLEQIAARYDPQVANDWITARQRVLPGITGWLHIHQIDAFGEKTIELDLEYLRFPTVGKVVKIVFCTLIILCIGKRRYLKLAGAMRSTSQKHSHR
jgi:lipopolysaccharide/colanic/teichoic acid biosynthesis glycosyltransferase